MPKRYLVVISAVGMLCWSRPRSVCNAMQPPAGAGVVHHLQSPLSNAKTVAYVVRLHRIDVDPHGKRVLIPGQRYSVMARLPASLRIEDATTSSDVSEDKGNGFDITGYITFVTDGRRQYEYDAATKTSIVSSSAKDLAHVTSEGITDVLAINLIFQKDWMSGLTYKAHDTRDGTPVNVYTLERVGQFDDPQAYVFYVSQQSGLPMRIVYGQDVKGSIIEQRVLDFTEWKLNGNIPPSKFVTTPPAGAKTGKVGQRPRAGQ